MTQRLAIVAGEGDLPLEVVQSALRSGREFFVIRIEGLAHEALASYPGHQLNLGQIGTGMQLLKDQGCRDVVFAGYMTRPDLAGIRFDTGGQALIPKILAAIQGGDMGIMTVFIDAFEEAGFRVLGAKDAYRDLLCPTGVLTQTLPSDRDQLDLTRGFQVAQFVGSEDIGQGCVVCAGLVLAVEAQEGTDAMLSRISDLDSTVRGTQAHRRGVLVKCPKPTQDHRVDLPTIGIRTIEGADRAGLAGIGLQASASLIIDQEAVIRAADEIGLFIFGIQPDQQAA